MAFTANDNPYKVTISTDGAPYANDHPYKVEIVGGGVGGAVDSVNGRDGDAAGGVYGSALAQTSPTCEKLTFNAQGTVSSREEWRAWLAAQKAAGTPVRIVYELATPKITNNLANIINLTNISGGATIVASGDMEIQTA